jgi:hypothetical protein
MHIHRRTLRADCPSLFANFYLHACAVVQTDSFPFINSIGWHSFGEIAKYSLLPTFVKIMFLAKGLVCQTRMFTTVMLLLDGNPNGRIAMLSVHSVPYQSD